MPRVIRKLEPVEPPDGRGWAVWTLLAALAAGVAWVVWTKADFADPMPWRNGWVLLAGLALTTAALVWASLRLKGRNMRRFQVGVLVSLLLHLWGAVAMERLSLALSIVPPAETEREAPTPNLAPAQEYYIETFVPPTVEATPEQTEYERPVATQTPEAEAAEVPRQEQETTPNRSEALAASQAELSSTVEPSPAEMSRAAEAAARRSPDTGQLSRRDATSATVAGEAAEAPPVEQPQQLSSRPDAAPAELRRTATTSALAPAQPTTNDAQRPSASAPSSTRAVAQDVPQTRDASPAASRAAAAAAAPEIAAADVESAAAASASSDQPGAASTALSRQATGGAAPNAIATSESSQPSAAASLARAATGAAGAPQVSAGGAASARSAAGGAAGQTPIDAPALAAAASGDSGPQAQTTALGQSASQVAGAAGGMIGAAAGDAPAAGSPAALSAAGRSSAAPSVAAAAGSGGARAAASGAVAGAAADAAIPGDSSDTGAAVAQGPAGTAVGRESTSLSSTAAATQIGAGGSPGLASPTAIARAASGQGDAQPSAALGSQAAVGRSVAQADLPSQAAPGDEGPAAADQAAGVPEALAPASGGGLGRLASNGPAAGSANAADDGLNPSPGQPLATGSPQAAVGALSPGVSLGGGSVGRLASATSISSRAAELADPGAGPGGGAGAPAPTATAIGRAGGGGAAQPAAGGFAGTGGGGPAAGSSGLARSSGAAAGGPQTAAVGGGSGRRAAASTAGAIDTDAAAPDVGEATTADSGGPAAAQAGLARADTGAPSDLGGGPSSPNSGAAPGAFLGGGPSRATASSSAGPAVATGGSGSGGRRTASALPSEMIADIPDEGGSAADGTAGGAPAPGDQPDRRTSGGLPVQVAAVDGPGGLGPQASANAGVPNRLARSDSNLIQANTGRFLRRDAGAPQAIDTRALDSAAPFAGRQRGGNLPPGANPGAAGGRTERAIELGLDFLARHQSNDGRWSLHNYAQGREGYPNEADAAALRSDSAATGLALLAFLGAGYDHVTGDRHQPVVAKGLDYLVGQQQNNGDLFVREDAKSNESAWLYSHAIATIALCEAYGMTGDVKLREPAQRAIDFAVASQHKTLGGWRYRPGFEADTSVTGWMLMALKSGELAGLEVPQESYQRVRKWLDSAQANREGQYVYNPRADDDQRQGRQPSNTMTAVGLLMRLYLGKNREDPELARGADVLVRNLPDLGTYASRSRDTYYWYYATQVMFHMRGDHWKNWNERLHPLLVGSQLQRGPLAGSWDPRRPVPDRWGPQAGRIYVTTMNLLSLEVTYRHLPIYDSTAQ